MKRSSKALKLEVLRRFPAMVNLGRYYQTADEQAADEAEHSKHSLCPMRVMFAYSPS